MRHEQSRHKSSRYRASVKQLYEAVDYYCRMIRIIIRIEELRQRIDRDIRKKEYESMNRFDTKYQPSTPTTRLQLGLTFFKKHDLHCMSFSRSISHENQNKNTLQSKIFLVADFGL